MHELKIAIGVIVADLCVVLLYHLGRFLARRRARAARQTAPVVLFSSPRQDIGADDLDDCNDDPPRAA